MTCKAGSMHDARGAYHLYDGLYVDMLKVAKISPPMILNVLHWACTLLTMQTNGHVITLLPSKLFAKNCTTSPH